MIWSIRGRRAFDALARNGRSSRSSVLWCRYLSDPAASPLRVGFSVGRPYGHAAERNRLRRRLRVLVDQRARAHGLVDGWLLLGARPSAKERTFDQLRDEVDTVLARATASRSSS